jgi:class 3 adenylate cyclase
MALADDLKSTVQQIFNSQWTTADGNVVPDTNSLQLGNDAVKLTGVVLYADLVDSTLLVDKFPPWFAAEVYKSFLHCAAKIIRSEGGEITAYDGDRVMAVYIHDTKNTAAARSALKINHAVRKIITSPRRQIP